MNHANAAAAQRSFTTLAAIRATRFQPMGHRDKNQRISRALVKSEARASGDARAEICDPAIGAMAADWRRCAKLAQTRTVMKR
jgi:hypothetical protein